MVKLPTPNPNKMLTKTPKFKLITQHEYIRDRRVRYVPRRVLQHPRVRIMLIFRKRISRVVVVFLKLSYAEFDAFTLAPTLLLLFPHKRDVFLHVRQRKRKQKDAKVFRSGVGLETKQRDSLLKSKFIGIEEEETEDPVAAARSIISFPWFSW